MAERQRIRDHLLARAVELFANVGDYDATVQRSAELFVPTLADFSAVDLLRDDQPYRVATADVPDPAWADVQEALRSPALTPEASAFLRSAARRREPFVMSIDGVEAAGMVRAPARVREFIALTSPASAILAPLLVGGECIGVFSLVARRGRPAFAQRDLALVHDVTRRLALAIRNAELQQRHQLLFDASPIPMWIFDRATLRILTVNAAAIQQYGYSAEEFRALTLEDLRPLGEIPALHKVLQEYQAPAYRVPAVMLHRRKDGSLLKVDVQGQDFTYLGRPARLIHIFDVTQREGTTSQLQRSEERYRLLSLAARVVIWDYDVRSGRVEWNPLLHEHLGYPQDALVSTLEWLVERTHPEDRDAARGSLEAAMRERRAVIEREYRFARGDGTWADISEVSHIGYDEQGATRVIGSMMDVTLRRQTAQKQANAQRMEAIGQLAGGVAHDFNNVLTGIQGFASLLLEAQPLQSEARQDLEEILNACASAHTLTRQLLAFSRRQVLHPRVVDLNAQLRQLAAFLLRVVSESIEIKFALCAELWPVFIDAGQVEQVVLNLVVNASDAMAGGGLLTIGTANVTIDAAAAVARPEQVAGDFAVISVTDTGCGMDAATLSHIFEPFFTTKEREKGTGLGLATSHGIVEQSGGFITVTSERGRGSCFTVHLPRASMVVAAPLAADVAPLARGGSETVLVIEDERAVRRVAARALRSRGYEVLEAESPEQALGLWQVRRRDIDIVVSDVVLPRMNGIQVVARMREERPDLRALFVSGYTEDAVPSEELHQEKIDLLDKPFSPDQLALRVRDALDREGRSLRSP